jgi:hypothetical protein
MQSHIATLILAAMIAVRADAYDGVPQPDPGDAGDRQRGRRIGVDEIRRGNITRLIINIPPRHLKSLCASIALPAWCLGHDPAAQVLCVSYAQDLSDKLSRDSRAIMNAAWYQRLFPTRLAADRQSMQEFATTAQGYRLATSVGGVLTGRGADLLIIDDPLKPDEAVSESQRKNARIRIENEADLRVINQVVARIGAIITSGGEQ